MTRILLITGSTRADSTSSAALRSASALEIDNVDTVFYEGLSDLPPFNPDDDIEPLPPEVARLRAQIDAADAVLFCTPEYAGTLPGSLKNLLDWTVKGGEMYGKAVASLTVASPGRGDAAQAMLRTVLGYVGAVFIEEAWGRITVPQSSVNDGLVADEDVHAQLETLLILISEH